MNYFFFQSRDDLFPTSAPASQSVPTASSSAEPGNVSTRSCSVTRSQTARMGQTRTPARSTRSLPPHFISVISFNILIVVQDPNRAPDCDLSQCQLPDCFCSPDGTRVPGNIDPAQVPQMITITFNGAVNSDNIDLYQVGKSFA